jgi:hypothetical protein
MATESACLLIADISGYTGYLAGVELDHAQDILADLMDTIVSALRPGFRLAKLEGDAAFNVRDHREGGRVAASRCDRALLLRLPAAAPRRAPGDIVPVQRVPAYPRPQPEVRRPPRHDLAPARRPPPGAARTRRHPRPSPAQERRDRLDGHRGIRAVQPAVCRRDGSRRVRDRHAPPARRTSTSASYPCGSTTSAGAGRRRSRARASSSASAQLSTSSTCRPRPRRIPSGSS